MTFVHTGQGSGAFMALKFNVMNGMMALLESYRIIIVAGAVGHQVDTQ